MTNKGLFIDDQWLAGEDRRLESLDPGTGETLWQGRSATKRQVDRAVGAARHAFMTWRQSTFQQRVAIIKCPLGESG